MIFLLPPLSSAASLRQDSEDGGSGEASTDAHVRGVERLDKGRISHRRLLVLLLLKATFRFSKSPPTARRDSVTRPSERQSELGGQN